MGGGIEFTYPSRNHLESILKCCYPHRGSFECNEFMSNYENISNETAINPYFKKAYQKIANCA